LSSLATLSPVRAKEMRVGERAYLEPEFDRDGG
jgi:hypothetical protein